MPRIITVALTAASGLQYALRLIDCLLASGNTVWVLHSKTVLEVAKQELDLGLISDGFAQYLKQRWQKYQRRFTVFAIDEWSSPVASGSNAADAMVVCPCSMGSLAAIALGLSDNLIERAADVSIKENKKLILLPRETPFSVIHLEHMLKLAKLGVIILPPNPGFYHRPEQVADLIDFVVARILDQLQIEHNLIPRWGDANVR